MRVFVIGATGYIGARACRRLLEAGHAVSGLARSDPAAAKLRAAQVEPAHGHSEDIPGLLAHAARVDAVILAAQMPSQEEEQRVAAALVEGYAGTGKTLIFTSGSGVLAQRTDGEWSEDTFAEDDVFAPCKYLLQRLATEALVRAAAQRDVRAMVLRPPMVWGSGYYGAVDRLLHSINQTGAACYVGRGLNLYTHVHVDDLADLYLLALEGGAPGALHHCAGGELNYRTLAELVARRHGVPTRSVTPSEAVEIWDTFSMLVVLAASSRTRSPGARGELGWRPSRLDLFEQVQAGELESRQRS